MFDDRREFVSHAKGLLSLTIDRVLLRLQYTGICLVSPFIYLPHRGMGLSISSAEFRALAIRSVST